MRIPGRLLIAAAATMAGTTTAGSVLTLRTTEYTARPVGFLHRHLGLHHLFCKGALFRRHFRQRLFHLLHRLLQLYSHRVDLLLIDDIVFLTLMIQCDDCVPGAAENQGTGFVAANGFYLQPRIGFLGGNFHCSQYWLLRCVLGCPER